MSDHAPGKVMPVVAPSGGFTVGKGYLVGNIFGVAQSTVAEGEVGQLLVSTRTVTLQKASGTTGTAHTHAYFDPSDGNVIDASATGRVNIGTFDKDGAVNGKTTCRVRLNGVAVTAAS